MHHMLARIHRFKENNLKTTPINRLYFQLLSTQNAVMTVGERLGSWPTKLAGSHQKCCLMRVPYFEMYYYYIQVLTTRQNETISSFETRFKFELTAFLLKHLLYIRKSELRDERKNDIKGGQR